MLVFIACNISSRNSYISNLLNAYQELGNHVICGLDNFFYSLVVPDILHIHWPETIISYINFGRLFSKATIVKRLAWYKTRGTIIVHTIHNILPHDITRKDQQSVFQSIINYSDILVHHCENSIYLLEKEYNIPPNVKNVISPHGDYLDYYKTFNKDNLKTKHKIQKEKKVVLVFGTMRPNKGLVFVEKVFNHISVTNKLLIVAGKPVKFSNYNIVRKLYNKNIRIINKMFYPSKRYLFEVIDRLKTAELFTLSDVVFLGHQAGLNSGILAMAATFKKPVVYPDIGCFSAQMAGWEGKAYQVGNINQATEALEYYLTNLSQYNILDNSEWLNRNNWKLHTNILLEVIKSLKDEQDNN